MANFALNANAFSKCSPAISTNIKQCGSVTAANAISLETGDLSTTFMDSGDFRVMEALLYHDFEIKMCETIQNGMYDFLMANRVNMSKRMTTTRLNSGLLQIAPFVLARQYSPINNEYWVGDNAYSDLTTNQANLPYNWAAGVKTYLGANDTATTTWYMRIKSTTNIPVDAAGTEGARAFPAGMRLYIDGKTAGGASTKTAWVIDASYSDGTYVYVALTPQNAGSNLDVDKLNPGPGQGAAKCLVRRGTPNVDDFEKWCAEQPAYLNWKNVPFWVETTRTSLCKSSLYDQWKKLVMMDNPLYKEFFDLDEIAKNRQLAADFQRRWVHSFFWNKPFSANQTLASYNSLPDLETYSNADDWANSELGVDGGRVIGKKANAVGVYEQLAECGRVYDNLGQQLNLAALFRELYNIMRVRESNGLASAHSIDIFTDSAEAELINQAMITYYSNKSQGLLRMTYSVDQGDQKDAVFGFKYRSYKLFWPNVRINIITHYYFDDYLTAASAAGQETTARVLWILDFAGIYPGILASKRVVQQTGDLKTLAAINPDFACVMEVPTQEQTLTSMRWTAVVECPASNLIIENFDDRVPSVVDNPNIDYSAGSSFSTSSTTA